jgi:hypothetical protein
MDHGPVLSRVYNLVANGDFPGDPSIWTAQISNPENYEVRLKGETQLGELSDAEIALLEEIFGIFGKLSRWDVVAFTHTLPEWINPEGSAISITYKDILRAIGKSESEIVAIEGELEELVAVDFLKPDSGINAFPARR